jgi:heme exporter protein CcmD
MAGQAAGWLGHPRAGYVLAAYGVAALCLGGMAAFAWLGYRRLSRQERDLRTERYKA